MTVSSWCNLYGYHLCLFNVSGMDCLLTPGSSGIEGSPVFGKNAEHVGFLTIPRRQGTSGAEV